MIFVVPPWAQSVAVILGPLSLIALIFLVFFYRKRDVTKDIDNKNIIAQKEYINTLEKEKIYLESEIKIRDEQIANLKKLLAEQKEDFQRQLNTLKDQIMEIKKANDQIDIIATTMKSFIPLTEDVKKFHAADSEIQRKLDMILEKKS